MVTPSVSNWSSDRSHAAHTAIASQADQIPRAEKERERSLSSDRPRSYEKGCPPSEDSPDSLIATQAMNGRIKIKRVRADKMNKALLAVFLIEMGIAAAQPPPPSDQTRQIELQKEAI